VIPKAVMVITDADVGHPTRRRGAGSDDAGPGEASVSTSPDLRVTGWRESVDMSSQSVQISGTLQNLQSTLDERLKGQQELLTQQLTSSTETVAGIKKELGILSETTGQIRDIARRTGRVDFRQRIAVCRASAPYRARPRPLRDAVVARRRGRRERRPDPLAPEGR